MFLCNYQVEQRNEEGKRRVWFFLRKAHVAGWAHNGEKYQKDPPTTSHDFLFNTQRFDIRKSNFSVITLKAADIINDRSSFNAKDGTTLDLSNNKSSAIIGFFTRERQSNKNSGELRRKRET